MKWMFYLVPTVLCIGLIATGLNQQESRAANSNEQLNPCSLREGQSGTIRGEVVSRRPMYTGSSQDIVTVLSNDCRVDVMGNRFKLREMGFQEGIAFTGSVQGGTITNVKGITKDRTLEGRAYPSFKFRLTHKPVFSGTQSRTLWELQVAVPEERRFQKYYLDIDRTQAAYLRQGEVVEVFYNPEDNNRVVEIR